MCFILHECCTFMPLLLLADSLSRKVGYGIQVPTTKRTHLAATAPLTELIILMVIFHPHLGSYLR